MLYKKHDETDPVVVNDDGDDTLFTEIAADENANVEEQARLQMEAESMACILSA